MKTTGLQLIGRGLFSKVYRLNENQVLIKSTCRVKECLSMNWLQSEGVFPEVERTDCDTYIMDYYESVRSLKESLRPDHYAIYRQLKSLSIGFVSKYNLYDKWREQFETISNEEYREALLDMIDNLCNYGLDISFECSPRNVAVFDGRLILLDVFFMAGQAEKIRKEKRKLNYRYN